MAGLLRQSDNDQELIDPENIGALRVRNSEGVEGVLQTVNGRQVFTPLEPAEMPSGPFDAAMLEAGRRASDIGTRFDAMMGDERAQYDIRQQDNMMAPVREEFPISTALGGALPGMAIPGGLPVQIGVGAAEGALDSPEAPIRGAVTGGAFGYFGSKLGDIVSDQVTGIARRLSNRSSRRARQAARDMAKEVGMPLTVAERSDSLVAEFFDRQASTVLGRQVKGPSKQKALNRAFATALGVPKADQLSGDVLSQAARQYGDVFEGVADQIDEIPLSEAFSRNLEKLESTAADIVPNARAMRQLERLQDMALSGKLNGKQYNRLRSEMGRISRAEWSPGKDQVSAEFVDDIIGVLDQALQEVAPAEMITDLSDARSGWKLLQAVRRGAALDAEGNVNPVSMARALESSYRGLDLNRFAPGLIGKAQRANLAATTFPPYKSSGTAERSILGNIPGLTAGMADLALGGGAGSQIGGGLARSQSAPVADAIIATTDGLINFIGDPDEQDEAP